VRERIYYAGFDNGGTFFDGDIGCLPLNGNPAEHCKYMTYPQSNILTGSLDTIKQNPSTGSWTTDMGVPRSDVAKPFDHVVQP
jgi:hypothetical protein